MIYQIRSWRYNSATPIRLIAIGRVGGWRACVPGKLSPGSVPNPKHAGSRIHNTQDPGSMKRQAGWVACVCAYLGSTVRGQTRGWPGQRPWCCPPAAAHHLHGRGGGGGAAKKAMHEWASKSAIVVRGMISCGMVWWSGTLVVRDCEVWCAV